MIKESYINNTVQKKYLMIVVKSWSFYGYLIMHGVYGEYIDMNLSIKIIKIKVHFLQKIKDF